MYEKDYDTENWEIIVIFNSLFTLWYSLIGIIFSSIFITSDFICNESCDQFVGRLDRFAYFFQFCLVINILAFLYNFTTSVFAWNNKVLFKPVNQEAEIRDEEIKV